MRQYSTREAAKKLGLSLLSIQRYIAAGKIPAPPVLNVGGGKLRIWTEEQIEHVRQHTTTLPDQILRICGSQYGDGFMCPRSEFVFQS